MTNLITLFTQYADKSSIDEATDGYYGFKFLESYDPGQTKVGDTVEYTEATKWTNVDTTLLKVEDDIYRFIPVNSIGGDEGGGELVERVVAVIKCTRGNEGTLMGYVKLCGYYESYNGIEWDSETEWEVVTPKPYTAYNWEAIK